MTVDRYDYSKDLGHMRKTDRGSFVAYASYATLWANYVELEKAMTREIERRETVEQIFAEMNAEIPLDTKDETR